MDKSTSGQFTFPLVADSTTFVQSPRPVSLSPVFESLLTTTGLVDRLEDLSPFLIGVLDFSVWRSDQRPSGRLQPLRAASPFLVASAGP